MAPCTKHRGRYHHRGNFINVDSWPDEAGQEARIIRHNLAEFIGGPFISRFSKCKSAEDGQPYHTLLSRSSPILSRKLMNMDLKICSDGVTAGGCKETSIDATKCSASHSYAYLAPGLVVRIGIRIRIAFAQISC
jgi:hypothetical protein